jgi:hypothetical protein
MIAGTVNANMPMAMLAMPPTTNQVRTPKWSATGPATIRPSGIMAADALCTNESTRPCISGATLD